MAADAHPGRTVTVCAARAHSSWWPARGASRSRTSTERTRSPRPTCACSPRWPPVSAWRSRTRDCSTRRSERAAELAIVNDVQAALAAELEPQAMYELVGTRANDVFDSQVVDIAVFDHENGTMGFPYSVERGKRFPYDSRPIMGFRKHVLETKQPLLIAEKLRERGREMGQPDHIKGEPALSAIFVPLLVGTRSWARSPSRTSIASTPSTTATFRCSRHWPPASALPCGPAASSTKPRSAWPSWRPSTVWGRR